MALEQLSLARTPVDGETDGVTNGVEHRPVATAVDGGEDSGKAPRLPRWTRQEILVLIQGKRVAESRVRRGRAAGMAFGGGQVVEPKWASVSSYCKRHGVNRGPVQCRKRWSNLAGDYKKIKEWESQVKDETQSFWVMRNDLRRERKLPGFFDREVYDILDGVTEPAAVDSGLALALAPVNAAEVTAEDSEAVFDSGRTAAAEEGMFSDFEHEETGGTPEKDTPTATPGKEVPASAAKPISATMPISEKQYQSTGGGCQGHDQGATSEKRPGPNSEPGSSSQDGRKRKRVASEVEDEELNNLQYHLIDVLDKNGKMLTAQLEAQNNNFRLDREQRKDHTESLVAVLGKLAEALGKIADKL